MNKKILFWFRQDLRISDNPALYEAAQNGKILPIYIFENEESFQIGSASKVWLHHSLSALNYDLQNKLNFYFGNAEEIIKNLILENKIDAIYWNRCYEPQAIARDSRIKNYLKNLQIECKSFNGSLLWEPWEVAKPDGNAYKVFTPFYKNGCLSKHLPRFPLAKPKKIELLFDNKNPTQLIDLDLLPQNNWGKKIKQYWQIGEKFAQKKLQIFLDKKLLDYKEGRNFPNHQNVSQLSPYLHFGEISPNQVWHAAKAHAFVNNITLDLESFLTELAWREFSYYLLYHFPQLPSKNFQSQFDKFPWQDDQKTLQLWQQGKTGYPIVDAGMRELWETGYMHNRVRMIVGSFLVKNLLIDWRYGAKWFLDCLTDADLASNSAGWQWIAGSGADAAPYFRIFNPVLQGERFDSEGNYTRKFLPELAKLPNRYLFKPWEAPSSVLKEAGIILGENYSKPIVDLGHSRKMALQAFAMLK
jgi:deoxyribodipyrimidine photo-lyase